MPVVSFSTPWKPELSWCFQGLRKQTSGIKLVDKVRLIVPGILNHLYEEPLQWRSFYKNDISQLLTLVQAIKISNSSSTKSTRATRHESYKTWDSYEYVRLEILKANEAWKAKEHVRFEQLKQVKDEEQKSTHVTRHEQHEKAQGTWHVRCKST